MNWNMESEKHKLGQLEAAVAVDSAIKQAAACTREKYAGEDKRIERALLLALNGHVTVYPDSTAIVRSERDPEIVYNVRHHHCDCPDWGNAPDGRCKHRLAAYMVRVAEEAVTRRPA